MSDQLQGVKLTSIQIDAASPDLIGTLIQQITNKVIESIPEGTFEKIAEETIKGGEIIYVNNQGYGSRDTVCYHLSNSAKKFAANLIEKQIGKLVEKHLESIETKKAIVDLVEIGISQAMQEIPKVAATEVVRRMTGAFLGTHQESMESSTIFQTNERVNKIVQELYNKQILNNIF